MIIEATQKDFSAALRRVARALARNWKKEVDAESAANAGRWRALPPPFFIFHRSSDIGRRRPGAICVARTCPGIDWTKTSPQHLKHAWPVDVAAAFILSIMWDASILPLDPDVLVYHGYPAPTDGNPVTIYAERGMIFTISYSSTHRQITMTPRRCSSIWKNSNDEQFALDNPPTSLYVRPGKMAEVFAREVDRAFRIAAKYKVTMKAWSVPATSPK